MGCGGLPKTLSTRPSPLGFLAWALVAGAGLGCGPIGATSLIGDAEIAVARAHAADGDTRAIYETTSADLYLQKAKEEQGHARYGPAMELARRSVELAEAATLKVAQQRTGSGPAAPAATIAHPQGEGQTPIQLDRPAPPKSDAQPAQRPVLIPGGQPPPAPKAPEKKEKQPISPEGGL